jgi:hypothetical protein
MVAKSTPITKPKLTDAKRHKHFVETAKEVGPSEETEDFDWVFDMGDKKKAP